MVGGVGMAIIELAMQRSAIITAIKGTKMQQFDICKLDALLGKIQERKLTSTEINTFEEKNCQTVSII